MKTSEKVILSAMQALPKNELQLNTFKRKWFGALKIKTSAPMSNKTELLRAYHKLLIQKRIKPNKLFEKLLTRRAVRSLSGVAIVTSLVKPYPCPGQCVYCPLDERMPKSYLAEEPAAMRALILKFDPYEQMAKRIEALEANGHPTDKIEFIIKGGTWNSYPLSYQYWFVLRSFEAANGKKSKIKNQKSKLTEVSPLADLKKELFRQQQINEQAKHRVIGLTLETRPDCIVEKALWQMREMGCTRVELGVQHTEDRILEYTKRGHSAKRAMEATKLLKDFGFKTDFHLMPQLPGATPQTDLAMLKEIFKNQNYRPDMIKIYPCTVVKGSELYDWFKAGNYHAYSTRELLDILKIFKSTIPPYCRISRLIRDIPGQYIEEGNKVTNLRQVIQEEMRREGTRCKCLRCREVGHVDLSTIKDLTPHLFVDEYRASGGTEYFLSFEDNQRRVVFAFCRLRIVSLRGGRFASADEAIPYLSGQGGSANRGVASLPSVARNDNLYPAYIRELHTYGQLIPVKQENKKTKKQTVKMQHQGLGKLLVKKAEEIVKAQRLKTLAVISGVGVRPYYRALGYHLEKTYMVKDIAI